MRKPTPRVGFLVGRVAEGQLAERHGGLETAVLRAILSREAEKEG